MATRVAPSPAGWHSRRRFLGLRNAPGRLAVAVLRLPVGLYRLGCGGMLGRTFLLFVHIGRTPNAHANIADTFYARQLWPEALAERQRQYRATYLPLYQARPNDMELLYELATAERAVGRQLTIVREEKIPARPFFLDAYRHSRALTDHDPRNLTWLLLKATLSATFCMAPRARAKPCPSRRFRRSIAAEVAELDARHHPRASEIAHCLAGAATHSRRKNMAELQNPLDAYVSNLVERQEEVAALTGSADYKVTEKRYAAGTPGFTDLPCCVYFSTCGSIVTANYWCLIIFIRKAIPATRKSGRSEELAADRL